MEEWKEYRLGDIISISGGFAYKGELIGSGDNYLLSMGCVSFSENFLDKGARQYAGESPDRFYAYPGDIVLATRQQSDNLPILGMPAIIPSKYEGHKMIVGANLYRVDIKDKSFNNRFLYWLLKTPSYVNHIRSCQSGTTVRMITKANIEDYIFYAPDKTTRDHISDFIWALDDKIEVNRKINENLEQQAQALFKSWFVDFEPFKNGDFVESELGMIPKGWRVGTLDEIGDIVGGSTPSKSKPEYYTDKGIAWLTPKDLSISNNKFTTKGQIDITEEGYKSCSTKLMPKGAVLFSSRAPIGYITIAKNDICTNQGFKSVVPRLAGTAFIYYFLKISTKDIENKATGSTFKEASGALMKSLQLIIAPERILHDFENIMKPLFTQQEVLEDESRRLAELRDTLLPKLMSGELNVFDKPNDQS